jgi:hypothetical protein
MAKLGKIETEKVKAFENPNKVEYANDTCYICDEKFLYPSDHDNLGKCPTCIDKDFCDSCENVFNEKELTENGKMEYECKECYQPKCGSCNEDVEKDGMFCCKECHELQYEE